MLSTIFDISMFIESGHYGNRSTSIMRSDSSSFHENWVSKHIENNSNEYGHNENQAKSHSVGLT